MNTSHDLSTLHGALGRSLAELNNAVLKVTAHDVLVRQHITYIRMSFFVIAAQALHNDMLAHAIKVFDEHRDAMSFWYIMRSNEGVMRRAAANVGLNVEELRSLSTKLRLIRTKTHFHIDRKSITDAASVWSEADIDGQALVDALRASAKMLALVKQDLFGGELETLTEYDGSDIPKIINAFESIHGDVHGA